MSSWKGLEITKVIKCWIDSWSKVQFFDLIKSATSTTKCSNVQIPRKETELKCEMKQSKDYSELFVDTNWCFSRCYGSDITVTIVSLFIGMIIEIMGLILEFLRCENLGTRIFKYSHIIGNK